MAVVTIVIEDNMVKTGEGEEMGAKFNITTDPPGEILESEYKRSTAFQCLGAILRILSEQMGVDLSQLDGTANLKRIK